MQSLAMADLASGEAPPDPGPKSKPRLPRARRYSHKYDASETHRQEATVGNRSPEIIRTEEAFSVGATSAGSGVSSNQIVISCAADLCHSSHCSEKPLNRVPVPDAQGIEAAHGRSAEVLNIRVYGTGALFP